MGCDSVVNAPNFRNEVAIPSCVPDSQVLHAVSDDSQVIVPASQPGQCSNNNSPHNIPPNIRKRTSAVPARVFDYFANGRTSNTVRDVLVEMGFEVIAGRLDATVHQHEGTCGYVALRCAQYLQNNNSNAWENENLDGIARSPNVSELYEILRSNSETGVRAELFQRPLRRTHVWLNTQELCALVRHFKLRTRVLDLIHFRQQLQQDTGSKSRGTKKKTGLQTYIINCALNGNGSEHWVAVCLCL
jgi:hypothetical protein